MEESGTQTITLELACVRGISVVVSYTGKGITEEQQHMALRPFFTTKQG